jgi:putative FmdB family regulatory protein
MPIYEYACDPCESKFEAFLASSSDQATCPKCQGTQLRRLMSTFAASVPGGYNDTYRGAPASGGSAPAADTPAPSGHVHNGCCGH